MKNQCTLTDAELIEKAQVWIGDLAKTGGRSWRLSIPVDFDNDPDMLFQELCDRLKGKTSK